MQLYRLFFKSIPHQNFLIIQSLRSIGTKKQKVLTAGQKKLLLLEENVSLNFFALHFHVIINEFLISM